MPSIGPGGIFAFLPRGMNQIAEDLRLIKRAVVRRTESGGREHDQ